MKTKMMSKTGLTLIIGSMGATLFIGVVGAALLVIGSALPNRTPGVKPYETVNNWLFAIGAGILFFYAWLNYLEGGLIFFAILQSLAFLAAVIMLMNVPPRYGAVVVGVGSAVMTVWSLYLLENYLTFIFVAGLLGISFGYVAHTSAFWRNLAFALGGAAIMVFSFIEGNWVFFWLNVFFTGFSAYHVLKLVRTQEE